MTCVCKSIKTTKLVQASTIACLSSAKLEPELDMGPFLLAQSNPIQK